MIKKLEDRVNESGSLLCVGLDPDHEFANPDNDYSNLSEMAYDVNKRIIEATVSYAACYKMNLAFYLMYPQLLMDTLNYIPSNIPVILDGKFGDILNTAQKYAEYSFDYLKVDGVTVNPYMGKDAIKAFSDYKEKMVFSLAVTSNPSAGQLQSIWSQSQANYIYEIASKLATDLGPNVGLVVGDANTIKYLRASYPETWFLSPGVGAQGGDLKRLVSEGVDQKKSRLLINIGRAIMKAGDSKMMREKAKQYMETINDFRSPLL